MMRGYGDRFYETVAALFNNTFPNRLQVIKSIIQRTVTRFEQTVSIKDGTGRPKFANNDDRKFYNHL